MSSFFQYARQTDDEEPEELDPIFSEVKTAKKENIIPPVGIAKPELVESFKENMGDEDKILKDIADIEAYEKENIGQSAIREGLSHVIRGGEGFFGGINSFLNLLTPELYQDEEGMPYEPGKQPKGLPGAEELHGMTKELTGKYFEPKSAFTKSTQETSSDIGSMFSTPGLGFLQKLLLPVGGQLVKQGIKASGGSEKSQDIGKLGFMTIASIANLGNAQKVASNAISEVKQMLPKGLSFSAKPTIDALSKIKKSPWYKTGKTASKFPAMEEIERIEKLIVNGKINAHDAIQLRQDINEARKQLGGFSFSPNQVADKKAARRYLDEVDKALMESIDNYGNKINPDWLNKYKLANKAYGVTQRSRQISDFIQQHAKPLQSETARILMHIGAGSAVAHLPAIAGAALPVMGAAKTVQIINRMIRSPILRNHYLDVLRQASLGNAAAM